MPRPDVMARNQLLMERAETSAARQVAAAYNQARRELLTELITRWIGPGTLRPEEALDLARQLGILQAIDAPPHDWASPLAVFEDALDHEQGVTARIYRLMDMALEERDHGTASFLKWFIDEQVEEESTVSTILDRLKMVGDDRTGLLFLDRELGARTGAAAASPAEGETASA